jgi:hypothetical protein
MQSLTGVTTEERNIPGGNTKMSLVFPIPKTIVTKIQGTQYNIPISTIKFKCTITKTSARLITGE